MKVIHNKLALSIDYSNDGWNNRFFGLETTKANSTMATGTVYSVIVGGYMVTLAMIKDFTLSA